MMQPLFPIQFYNSLRVVIYNPYQNYLDHQDQKRVENLQKKIVEEDDVFEFD